MIRSLMFALRYYPEKQMSGHQKHQSAKALPILTHNMAPRKTPTKGGAGLDIYIPQFV